MQTFAASRLPCEPSSRRINANIHGNAQSLQLLKAGAGRSVKPARLSVTAQAKGKADPPDVPKSDNKRAGGREWFQSILSRFGPVREKASNTTVLDFEKPLVELDNRIKEVRILDTRYSCKMYYNSGLFNWECWPEFLITCVY